MAHGPLEQAARRLPVLQSAIRATAERLKVIGFTSEDVDYSEWAWGLWQTNRMDYTQVVIHTEAVMLGDSYVLCDWDAVKEELNLA